MLSDHFPVMKKSAATFLDNTTLAILEYILEEGIDGALANFKDIDEEDIRVFPHVMQAMKDRGYFVSNKTELN